MALELKMASNHSNGNSSLEMAQSSEDLLARKGKRKKRAWILGSIITLIVIAVLIATIVLLATDTKELGLTSESSAITLEDILEGRLIPRSFNASWISDNELLYRDVLGNVVLYNVEQNSTKELLSRSNLLLQASFEYELSPDKNYLLLAHDYQKLYRHTYLAKYTVINLETKITTPLAIVVDSNIVDVLQYATWGPVGNSVVYIVNNNIYYKQSATSDTYKVITTDGAQGNIYNGIPDWVYEEEVFSSNKAFWFSPDGKKLAYAKFNDTRTSLMTIPFYGTPGSLDSQYTRAIQIRYPKPGTPNPDVSLHVVNLDSDEAFNINTPPDLSEEILAAVSWATNDIISAIWMNRVQNEAYIVAYDTADEESIRAFQTIKHLKENAGWLELFTPPIFSKDGSQLLIILSQAQRGDLGSFRHVTRFIRQDNAHSEALTSGAYVVTEILAWDEDRSLVYYQATTENDPAVQHVYSVSTTTKQTQCISCDTKTSLRKKNCLYNSAKFSGNFSHYILNCAGPDIPEISVHNSNNNKISIWENNEDLVTEIKSRAMPKIQRFVFDIDNEFKAQVLMKLPPNIDLSGNTKYPMVVNVYGGPDSYQVLEKFSMDWGSYLAANKSIIYATIDGRGSGLKGDKMLFAGYRQLGTVEIVDQINVTRQIQQNVPYVDATRTAIWGWSYGGYASGLALSTDTEGVFKCGMSVAPVTDWTLYDSIYTERFMGLPKPTDNLVGYENAKLLNKYEGLRDKQYFLVHGTFDDNVHYQQSMLWSKVLEHKDILFRQQSYPDEDHGLAAVRPHLYHTLENFLDECFIEGV